jgi:hypothetical protein
MQTFDEKVIKLIDQMIQEQVEKFDYSYIVVQCLEELKKRILLVKELQSDIPEWKLKVRGERWHYPKFRKFLEYRKFTTQSEVRLDQRTEFDVIGWRILQRPKGKYRLACIEVKGQDVDGVMEQASVRCKFFDYVYVAFWINMDLDYILYKVIQYLNFLKEYRIGVLIYDELRDHIWEVFRPKISKKVDENSKQRVIGFIKSEVIKCTENG